MTTLQLTVEKNGKLITRDEYPADRIVSIGRGEGNDLILESSNVSRNHCQLVFENGNWLIEDLGSTNGVELDGVRVGKEIVKNGSSIVVRPFLLRIILPSEDVDGTIADSTLTDGTLIENATQADLTVIGDEEEQTFVGGVSGEEGTYIQEGIQQNFILVQNGLSAGVSVPLFEENLIGSQVNCDLVLQDAGIESEHLRISYDGIRYSFVQLSSGESVVLNGKNVSKGSLKDGDSLLLGEIELCLRIQDTGKGSGIAGVVQDNLKVILLLALLAMMAVTFIALSGGDSEHKNELPAVPPFSVTPSSPVDPAPAPPEAPREDSGLSLEEKRQYARLLYKAKQFMDAGEYKKAANRLDAALGIDSQSNEAEELFQQCQEEISTALKETAEKSRLISEYKSEAQVKISQAEKYIQSGDLMSALEVVKELNTRKKEFPELVDIHTRIEALETRIEKDEQDYQKKRTGKKVSFEQQLAEVRRAFEQGMLAYKSGQFREARAQWEIVAATKLGVPERKQAVAHLKQLEEVLSKKNKLSLEKAATAMRKKDYSTALYYYHQVLAIDPDHSEAKAQYEKILVIQVKEAQHYYQKGLVYEGINNIDQAGNDWRQVLKILPVEESEYHIKAKQKLAEYGLQ